MSPKRGVRYTGISLLLGKGGRWGDGRGEANKIWLL
jgi:hypothetical protein